jgi:hypothetical protein
MMARGFLGFAGGILGEAGNSGGGGGGGVLAGNLLEDRVEVDGRAGDRGDGRHGCSLGPREGIDEPSSMMHEGVYRMAGRECLRKSHDVIEKSYL